MMNTIFSVYMLATGLFIQVDDNIFRGPRPESMKILQENGFKEVIDLESGAYEFFHDDQYEIDREKDFGIVKRDFRWSDVRAPSEKALRKVAKILHDNNRNGVMTYIHCLHGNDRTGMAIAAYKIIYRGTSKSDAIKEMYERGFHRFPYQFWVSTLEKL
jgi:tyrosine-protein phosphatase SIW14